MRGYVLKLGVVSMIVHSGIVCYFLFFSAMSDRVINPNLTHLHRSFVEDKTGALLEGSSRSRKTWSSIDFIIYLTSQVSSDWTINIIKETYNSFKTTLYDDFNRRLPMAGIQSPFADKQEVKTFRLYGNKINLLGAENESVFSGNSCDIAYFNEMLDISQNVFDDTEQRCRRFWWGDYNPKFTEHWVYDKVGNRKDVAFLKTTFKDNPYITKNERRKILSYQSVSQCAVYAKVLIDKKLESNQAIAYCKTYPIKKNPDKYSIDELIELLHCVKNENEGTADDYRWNVFGLGLRTAPEGLIFQHVTWLKEFPSACERIFYGSDLGYTNSPSTIVKCGVSGNNLYLEKKFYQPTPSCNEYVPAVREHVGANNLLVMDSADALGFIMECRKARLKVMPVTKFNGSIKYGISLMKKYKIHLVDCPEWRKEQGQYIYRVVNGIRLDEPIDDFNHLWDAARYAALVNLIRA